MKRFLSLFSILVVLNSVVLATPNESLNVGFQNPPQAAKPQTWWHWMNGNITKAGITADLEAMKQIGLGVLWMPPFIVDITNALVEGKNDIVIEATNVWVNRLIGEERYPDNTGYDAKKTMPDWFLNNQPQPAGKRTTFTTVKFYNVNDPLVSSGLIGPVQIKVSKVLTNKL